MRKINFCDVVTCPSANTVDFEPMISSVKRAYTRWYIQADRRTLYHFDEPKADIVFKTHTR